VEPAALRQQIQAGMVRLIADVVLFNRAVAQHLGLGSTDAQFMTLLQVHGPLTPGRLAQLSGLTTGTVTGVIDRLEQAGFVRRTRDDADRRKVIVERREDAIAERLYPYYGGQAQWLETVLGRRTPDELRVISDFLTDMTADSPDRPRPP
jgi:DNA-binding MarR family transcriptional regulator